MKARSFVFAQIQSPATIFGLPPKMMGLAAAAVLLVYMGCIIFRLAAIMVPATVATAVLSIAGSYYLAKNDPHVETVFLTCARFWRASPCRRLLAGAPLPRSRERGRS
jgi:hypothetical protein